MAFSIHIEKLVYGGRGLGRHNGRVVLTPFVLPGEQVQVEPEKESQDLITARTVSIESLSPSRIPAPCPYFGRCGGCYYQHIPYEQQLEFKRQILLETLLRVGKIQWSGPVEVVAGEPWHYRNRTQLHLQKRGTDFQIGYFEYGSHRLCPVDACPISSPAINRTIQVLSRLGRERRFPEFLRQIELFTNERDLLLTVLETGQPLARRFFEWCAREIEGLRTESFLDYEVGAEIFRVGSRSFFQVNRFLIGRLAALAISDHTGGTALDLYTGVGLLSLPLARRFSRVIALDASSSAIRNLHYNAQRAGLEIEIHHGPADRYLETLTGPLDFILADSPRSGLGPSVTSSLIRLRARHITLVSCDPATLARDLRPLTAAGFQVISLKMIDFFPQTFHIESVVELQSG